MIYKRWLNRSAMQEDVQPKLVDDIATECDNVTAGEEAVHLEDIGYTIVLPTICAVGIVLNVLNITVLCRKPLNTSVIYTYLGMIAIADLITLTLVAPIGLARCSYCGTDGTIPHMYEMYIYMPLANSSATTSIWLV